MRRHRNLNGLSLRAKLLAVLMGGLVLFVVAGLWWKRTDDEGTQQALASSHSESKRQFEQLIDLKSKSLATFVEEWAMWDETTEFVSTRSAEWEEYNLDPYFEKSEVEQIVVFDPKWRPVYDKTSENLPNKLSHQELAALLAGTISNKTFHREGFKFDQATGAIHQIIAEAIVKSDDPNRRGKIYGFLVAVRRWDQKFKLELANLTQANVSFRKPGTVDQTDVDEVSRHVRFTEKSMDGKPEVVVDFSLPTSEMVRSIERGQSAAVALLVCLLSVGSALPFAINHWFLRPVRKLSLALETDDPRLAEPFKSGRDEVGILARSILTTYWQRQQLDSANQELTALNEELTAITEEQQNANLRLAELMLDLEHKVSERTMELEMAIEGTIAGWSQAMDHRDQETEGHTRRVAEMAVRLGKAAGLSKAQLKNLYYGSLLHDIGKIGIPDSILLKPGKLTDEEYEVMKGHTTLAYKMLHGIPYVSDCLDVPLYHHERWDGSGYPAGLKGDKIPYVARLFALADVWDALRSNRPYRSAWSEERTREYISENAGTHFDPELVSLFMSLEPMKHPSDEPIEDAQDAA